MARQSLGLLDTPSHERFFWRNLGDTLVVVDLTAFEFTILNKTAGAIWLSLLDADWVIADLVEFLSDNFSTVGQIAESDLDTLFNTWHELGWLEKAESGTIRISSQTTSGPPPPYHAIPQSVLISATTSTMPEWSMALDFIGATVEVRFHCDPDLSDSDISLRARAFLNGLPQSDDAVSERIDCFVTQTGIYLRRGSLCIKATDVSDGLSRLVLWCFYVAYGRDSFLGTFHAAALGRAGGAILMPGLSGVGKSTLTAYLCRKRWLYGGDDIVGVSMPQGPEAAHFILPFCSAISVKQGSVDLLSPLYPGLGDLPLVQYDTKVARFPCVPVGNQMTVNPAQRSLRAIVFPIFKDAGDPALHRLSTEEALLSLVGVGFRTGEVMDRTLLDNLFDVLEKTPKYRLTFSSLEDAERLLENSL